MSAVLHVLRKRPLTSLGVAGFGGVATLATAIEAHSEWQEQRSLKDPAGVFACAFMCSAMMRCKSLAKN